MTAICAYWSRDGAPHAAERIDGMVTALAPYGRDRASRWSNGPIAMAINHHQTLPEDQFDAQPAFAHGIVLVADLRLDERDTLARQLGLSSAQAAHMADSALLHAAWRAWGAECVHRLVGEFAFVVWNEGEQSLFCARDPIGARPLYYTTIGRMVAVSSMPKGVLALPELPRRLDELRMAEYLALLPGDGTRTFFQHVSLLPPGHTLHVTPERIATRAYWSPPHVGSVRLPRDEDYVDRFLELFEQAVAATLRTTGPMAALVSGGFDSSSVTSLAARQLMRRGERLQALTWIPQSGADAPAIADRHMPDESRHVAALAQRHPNVDHGLIGSPDVYPLALLPVYQNAWDQPILNPIKVPMLHATAQRLAALGCGVALHGQGGNMTISYDGLTLLPTLLSRGRWLRGARETAALARAPGWSTRSAVSMAVTPLLPPTVIRGVRRLRGHAEPAVAYSAIRPECAAAHDLAATAARRGWSLEGRGIVDAQSLRTQLMRRLDVGTAMKGLLAAMGVEYRDPTWDVRLLNYCWAIPEDQFLRGGRTRWLLRRAMDGILPPVILDETRRGLQSADWPRFLAPYRAAYSEELAQLERSPRVREFIDVAVLRQLVDRWPTTWTIADRFPYGILLLRSLGAGQFIRQFEA